MNQVLFEGVRCFHDFNSCPLKPITLLVGENSSGKTTFLALTRIAWDIARGNLGEDIFNEEPFLLGSYDQIASLQGGRAGRAKSFFIGLEAALNLTQQGIRSNNLFSDKAKIIARFSPKGSESRIDEWRFECGNFSLSTTQPAKESQQEIKITTPRGSQSLDKSIIFHGWISIQMLADLPLLISMGFQRAKDILKADQTALTEVELDDLRKVITQVSRSFGQRPYAFAPIRTRPQRTYDPLKEVPKPEGSHVPMVLARTFLDGSNASEGLQSTLNSFGKASGLFSSVEVKRKGNKESDPFQIGVKTIGQTFNLVDVGYGVSQVLPIVVDVLQNPKNSTFLLQQPEVHLHPKAQAELGSFLAVLAKEQNKRFIIETHSDNLIDRIRMDVRDKKYLTPNDVAILYFEKMSSGVKIHHLELDEFGNFINVPSTYRQFFLAEESRMLGV